MILAALAGVWALQEVAVPELPRSIPSPVGIRTLAPESTESLVWRWPATSEGALESDARAALEGFEVDAEGDQEAPLYRVRVRPASYAPLSLPEPLPGELAVALESTPLVRLDADAAISWAPAHDATARPWLRLLDWRDAIAARLQLVRDVAHCRPASALVDATEASALEHAVLLAACARADGIPARLRLGLRLGFTGWLPHVWTEVWVDGWRGLDATLDGRPFDAARVPLWSGHAVRKTMWDEARELAHFWSLASVVEVVDPERRPVNDLGEWCHVDGSLVTAPRVGLSWSVPEGWTFTPEGEGGGLGMFRPQRGDSLVSMLVVHAVEWPSFGDFEVAGATADGHDVLCGSLSLRGFPSNVCLVRDGERLIVWLGMEVEWDGLEELTSSLRVLRPERNVDGWSERFDGQTLAGWRASGYAGEAEARVENGALVLGQGEPLTGITAHSFPEKVDYEVELTARRVFGTDFFCGLTFPVGEDHLSLVLGGWGGSLVGLSCLDGADASENHTRQFRAFEAGRDVVTRVRVTAERLQVWVDDEPVIDLDPRDYELSVRGDVTRSMPLGLACFITEASYGRIRVRTW